MLKRKLTDDVTRADSPICSPRRKTMPYDDQNLFAKIIRGEMYASTEG